MKDLIAFVVIHGGKPNQYIRYVDNNPFVAPKAWEPCGI